MSRCNLVHRPATAQEHAFLAAMARFPASISMRAMAYALRDGQQAERNLIELKAVDDRLAAVRRAQLSPPDQKLADVLYCEDDGVCGAAAEQSLLDRLHVEARRSDPHRRRHLPGHGGHRTASPTASPPAFRWGRMC